jgi:hypothetical protein
MVEFTTPLAELSQLRVEIPKDTVSNITSASIPSIVFAVNHHKLFSWNSRK